MNQMIAVVLLLRNKALLCAVFALLTWTKVQSQVDSLTLERGLETSGFIQRLDTSIVEFYNWLKNRGCSSSIILTCPHNKCDVLNICLFEAGIVVTKYSREDSVYQIIGVDSISVSSCLYDFSFRGLTNVQRYLRSNSVFVESQVISPPWLNRDQQAVLCTNGDEIIGYFFVNEYDLISDPLLFVVAYELNRLKLICR